MKYWIICHLLILTRIRGSSGQDDFDGATKTRLCHIGELLCELEYFKPSANKKSLFWAKIIGLCCAVYQSWEMLN